MQLIHIDKQRYSKHYRIIFWAVVAIMLVVSLSVSTLLITLIGNADESNFWLNVIGVIAAALVIAGLLKTYHTHPFMHEVKYVWQLKQHLNKIYRKQRKIEPTMAEGNRNAMIIMNFFYQGSKQLYLLDNNTITLDDLQKRIDQLESLLEEHKQSVSLEEFNVDLLSEF